jgi:hypothetical protein
VAADSKSHCRKNSKGSRSFGSLFLLVLAAWVSCIGLVPSVLASRLPITIHFREVQSESDAFQLTCDPSSRDGDGESTLKLTKDGKLLWTKTIPVMFENAFLGNDGQIIGYGYTTGKEGLGDPGAIVIFIIDRFGEILLEDRLDRIPTRFLHGDATPTVNVFAASEGTDSVLIQLNGQADNQSSWRIYSRNDAQLVRCIEPNGSGMTSAIWIRDTEYLVVQTTMRSEDKFGARYRIMDTDGIELWLTEWPEDYQCKERERERALLDYLWEHGTLKSEPNADTFSIERFADQARVTFKISDQGGVIDVQEIATAPTEIPPPPPPMFGADRAAIPLEPIGMVNLTTKEGNEVPIIRDIACGFVFDSKGNIVFVRSEEQAPDTLVKVTRDGLPLGELPLRVDTIREGQWTGLVRTGDNQYLLIHSGYESNSSRAWTVNLDQLTIEPMTEFQSPHVESIATLSDGSFVLVSSERLEFTINDQIAYFDSQGRKQWSWDRNNAQIQDSTFTPKSVSVTENDEILLLNTGGEDEVRVYNRSGNVVRRYVLSEHWDTKPNYPTDVFAAKDGQFWVYDFQAAKPLVCMNEQGEVVQPLKCHGRNSDQGMNPLGQPRVDFEGRIWVASRNQIMRLDSEGVVNRSLPKRARKGLDQIDDLCVERDGRVYATSASHPSAFRFRSDGVRDLVIQSSMLANKPRMGAPVVGPEGDIFLAVGDSYSSCEWIRFDAQGRFLDRMTFDTPPIRWLGPIHLLQETYDELQILDTNTRKPVKTISRKPDNSWLDRIYFVSVAPSGQFAVYCRFDNHAIPKQLDSISIYKPNGEPLRTIPISGLYIDGLEYDGEFLFVTDNELLYILNTDGQLIGKYSLKLIPGQRTPYLKPTRKLGTKELLMVDRNNNNRIYRFTLPSAVTSPNN